jgi:PAS domain S-box-containing protein
MNTDRSFLWKAACGLAVIVMLLVGIGVQTMRVSKQQDMNFARASHAHVVSKAIDEVSANLREAGTSQRAYISTNTAMYLDQFEKAQARTLLSLTNLEAKIADNLTQVGTFSWYKALVEQQVEIYNSNVNLQIQGDLDGAKRMLSSGRGYTQMETIADATKIMEREEDEVLSKQIVSTRDNVHQTEVLVLGGLGLSFLVIVFAGLTIFRDMNRRLAVEGALAESLNFERALVSSAAYGIIAVDANGIITEFNKAAEDMLGYTAEELVGKSTPERFHDPKEIAERAAVLSNELGRTVEPGLDVFMAIPRLGRVEDREVTFIRRNGERFVVQLSVTAIPGSTGEVTGFIGIASDITERKKIERLKAEFISTVSHELRTPLTSIRGALGLVLGGLTGDIPGQAKELLNVANKNAERLSRLINDILDIEKIESGKMEFKLQRQFLAPLLQQAVESIQDFARQFNVTVTVSNMIPDQEINVDGDRFIQVMVNLLSNAAKFSPPNSAVSVTAERRGGILRVSVSDRGKGIPFEFQSRVFEKFGQADSSDSRAKSGTGLGLSITKVIVEKLGGVISFDTKEGLGTTFHVDLPGMASVAPAEAPGALSGARRKVLICEDDPDIAYLLRLMLKQGGFDADVVLTAADAKARLRTGAYFALSLDINLPDQNGLEFFRELRADPLTHDIPVVVVSAEADRGKKELNGSAIGIVDWLDKPIDEKRLLDAVRRAVLTTGSQRPRVLHVEDDADLSRIVQSILAPVAEVQPAGTIAEAMAKIRSQVFDLVLLDISLPDGKGSDILPFFGARLPVVIFSAHDVPDDVTRQVASALVKSRTSNDALLTKITEIIARNSPPVSVAS